MRLCLAPEKTIRQTVDAFYESSAFRKGGPRTRAWKRYELEAFCATEWKFGRTFGDLPIASLTFGHVDAVVVAKLDRPGACQSFVRVLRALIKFAIKAGIPIDDPTYGIELPSLNPRGFRMWTEEEIAIFEAKYPIGTMERRVLALALFSALRRQDLVILGRQHIHHGAIYICPEKTRMTTGVFLVIPIHPELARVLAAVPESQKTFLQNPFGRASRPFKPNHLTNWFAAACHAAGLPKGLCLHGLRKAACRRLAEAGCTVHEIMAISGHRTLRQVERYTMTVSWEKLAKTAMGNLTRAFPSSAI